jgi:hypothetical protein
MADHQEAVIAIEHHDPAAAHRAPAQTPGEPPPAPPQRIGEAQGSDMERRGKAIQQHRPLSRSR